MSSIKDRDYSFMKGTEVSIIDSFCHIQCFIADIDIDKGISIVDIDNWNREIICINKEVIEYMADNYYGCFASTVAKCKKGKLPAMLSDRVRKRDRDYSAFGEGAPCAFK